MRAKVSPCIAGRRRGHWDGQRQPWGAGTERGGAPGPAIGPARGSAQVRRGAEAGRAEAASEPALGKAPELRVRRQPCFAEREPKAPGPASHLVCEAQLQLTLPRQGGAAPQLESEP